MHLLHIIWRYYAAINDKSILSHNKQHRLTTYKTFRTKQKQFSLLLCIYARLTAIFLFQHISITTAYSIQHRTISNTKPIYVLPKIGKKAEVRKKREKKAHTDL